MFYLNYTKKFSDIKRGKIVKIPFFTKNKEKVTLQRIEQEHFNQAIRLKNWHVKEIKTQNIIIMLTWCEWVFKKFACNKEQFDYILQKQNYYLQQLKTA
jgi:hypothetical protein